MSPHVLFCSNFFPHFFFSNAIFNGMKSLIICFSQYVALQTKAGNDILGIIA